MMISEFDIEIPNPLSRILRLVDTQAGIDSNPCQQRATLHRPRRLRNTLPGTSMISPCFFHALPKIAAGVAAEITAVNNTTQTHWRTS
jgi:hypothetical protein